MSKERARRRAERLALAERERVAREAARRRRERRRATLRRLRPRLPDRRTGKLFARRSRGERAGITVAVALVLVVGWLLIDSLAVRLAFTAAVILAAPALVVLTLNRRI